MAVDLIITNAKGLTMDAATPRVQAVAASAGRIVAVGGAAEIAALAGPDTRLIDAGGRTLLPGFVESHMHLLLGGAGIMQLHVHGLRGIDSLKAAVEKYRAANPDLPIIMGQGAEWGMLGHPMTRHDLDKACPDLPLALSSPDHHTVWANTVALERAGILRGGVTEPGHEIVMGPDGLALGQLNEVSAFAPVQALGGEGRLMQPLVSGEEPDPAPTIAERAADIAKLRAGLAHCAGHGITSIINMDGNRYILSLIDEVRQQGGLTARVKVPFHFKPHMELAALDRAEAMTRDYNDDWLSSGFVKMFIDGVLGSHTALMVDGYPGDTTENGAPLFELGRFSQICAEIDRRGLQFAVHSVGDGAVRAVLDGIAAGVAANGARDSRHRVEHCDLIHADDVQRFVDLGAVASIQPSHPPGLLAFPAEPNLSNSIGKDRFPQAYLWKSLADRGIALAFSSDWPVAEVSVLASVQAAMTRQPYEGAADERMPLIDVLHAYTAGGAFAAHMEDRVGRLMPGLCADFVLLGDDIETVPADQIGAMGIALTVAGGRITHQGAGFAG